MARVSEYNYIVPEEISSLPNLNDRNPSVDNVTSTFGDIRSRGDYMGFWDGDQIRWPRYTQVTGNKLGFNNHFQSMQRLRKGKYMAVSGGDPHESMSHLFVVEMKSRNARGGWRSNVLEAGQPSDDDKIVRTIGIDAKKWHAGGISALGDILAVPIYSTKPVNSEIVFLYMENPKDPKRFNVKISRPGVASYAVAFTKLQNGHFLLAVWGGDNRPSPPRPRCLDFYLSRSENFFEGFIRNRATWYPDRENINVVEGQDRNFGDFQSINFINQADGGLFLVGMHNNSDLSPHKPGSDYADLYRIEFADDRVFAPAPKLSLPSITKVSNKRFYCLDQQCHFDASSGIHVDASGILRLYSCYYWSDNSLIKFNEYRPAIDSPGPTIKDIRNAWVDLYEYANFGGRVMSLVSEKGSALADYRRISVQGRAFNDVASSVRFQLPEGVAYRLFKDRNFRGKFLELGGTGEVREFHDFALINFGGTLFENGISSSRYVHVA